MSAPLKEWMGNSPLEVNQFLFKKVKKALIQRVVLILPEKDIRQLIRIISPSEASFIIKFKEDVNRQHVNKKLLNIGSNQFGNDLWLVLLNIILGDRGSVFSQKVFILTSLEKLSQHYNLIPYFFIEQIVGLIETHRKAIRSSHLLEIFLEIKKDFLYKKRKKPDAEKIKSKYCFEFLTQLIANKGDLYENTNIGKFPFRVHQNKKEIIQYLIKSNPLVLKDWISLNMKTEVHALRFFQELDIKTLKRIISLMNVSGKIQVNQVMKVLLKSDQYFDPQIRNLSELDLYQFALMFFITSKQTQHIEHEYFTFLIRKSAEKLSLDKSKLTAFLLAEADKIPDTLTKKTSQFLAKEYKVEQIVQESIDDKPIAEENELTRLSEPISEKSSLSDFSIPETGKTAQNLTPIFGTKGYQKIDLWQEVARIKTTGELESWFHYRIQY